MSAESFAALRRNAGSELADLAEEHYKHEYVPFQALSSFAPPILAIIMITELSALGQSVPGVPQLNPVS